MILLLAIAARSSAWPMSLLVPMRAMLILML